MIIKSIGDEEFDSLTFDSNTPTLVLFGTRRCKVCKEQLPIVEQITIEFQNMLKAYWVDVERNKTLFYRFRLQGIPNILLFNQGEVQVKIRGLNSKETLVNIINTVLFNDNNI